MLNSKILIKSAKNLMEKNRVPLIVVGPSGVGKSTILKQLFEEYAKIFEFSISNTTRPKRSYETQGKEYYFTPLEEF